MRLPFTITTNTITVVLDNRPKVLRAGSMNFESVRDALRKTGDHDVEAIRNMVDIPSFVTKQTFGRVKIGLAPDGKYGIIFDGVLSKNVIAERLIDMAMAGSDVESVARFLDNVMDNPLETARDELYLWLESGATPAPFCSDGRFLAYKRVRNNYTDIHSGKFDNSVGKIVQMPRELVDPNRRNECSSGLHFCSLGYLAHFRSAGQGDRVMILAINPADVVAIPGDYQNQKGRTWRYEVVGEVPTEDVASYNLGIVAAQVDAEAARRAAETTRRGADISNVVQAEGDPEDATPAPTAKLKALMQGKDNKKAKTVAPAPVDKLKVLKDTLKQRVNKTYTPQKLLADISKHGQRGLGDKLGIARSTIYDWMKRAQELGIG
jgi:hypothetical protein